MPSRDFQFVFTSTPSLVESTSSSSPQKRLARSHAARSAHAKIRRQRTIEYQAQKAQEAAETRRTRPAITSPGIDPSKSLAGLTNPLCYHRRDPFQTCARRLRPTEEMLFDHYLTSVIPLMRCNAYDLEFGRRMVGSWIPLATSEEGLLDILLLAAVRHLSECYASEERDYYNRIACQYKLLILRSLQTALAAEGPQFSDVTVLKAIMLAYDELFVKDEQNMKRHVAGAVRIVAIKGGPKTLGLDGLIERLLFNLLAKVNKQVGLTVKSPWDRRIASMELNE
ncbi:hypothetical protein BDV18DRAFT_161546 [Aspergillus unguis]